MNPHVLETSFGPAPAPATVVKFMSLAPQHCWIGGGQGQGIVKFF